MPSHMSSIGFPVATEDDFLRYQTLAADNGEPLPAPGGLYVRWQAGQGAELWVQVTPDNAIVGLNPHFAGEATLRVSLQARLLWPNEGGLDGAFSAWVLAEGDDDPEHGFYPLVFDAPDFALHSGLTLPAVAEVQLAAFAEELHAYPDDRAFADAQPADLKFGPEAFVPSRLFAEEEDEGAPPQAYAVMSGHVVRADLLTNSATGEQFYWIRTRTLGGEVDVVVDPSAVRGEVVEGGVVAGTFWLSGRIRE